MILAAFITAGKFVVGVGRIDVAVGTGVMSKVNGVLVVADVGVLLTGEIVSSAGPVLLREGLSSTPKQPESKHKTIKLKMDLGHAIGVCFKNNNRLIIIRLAQESGLI